VPGWPLFPYNSAALTEVAWGRATRLHPHGVLTISVWATFASEGAGFARLFPGLDMHPGARCTLRAFAGAADTCISEPAHAGLAATLLWNFRTPIARELMLLLGFVDASAPTLRRVLKVGPDKL